MMISLRSHANMNRTYLILTSERASVIKTVSNCLSALGLPLSPPKVSADSCSVTFCPLGGVVTGIAALVAAGAAAAEIEHVSE